MRSGTARAFLSTLVLAGLAMLASAPAAAQEGDAVDGHEPRGGFWLGVAAGGGVDSNGDGVAGGHLRFGHALSSHVLVGGDVTVWGNEVRQPISDATRNRTAWSLGGSVRVYPDGDAGWFLRSSAGVSLANVSEETFDNDETGLSLSVGAGHDFRLGEVVLAPGLNFYGHYGDSSAGVVLLTVSVGLR